MRAVSNTLRAALQQSHQKRYSADLVYDGTRRFEDLPIKSPSFNWDGTADVEGSGSVTVVWTSPDGSSIVPRDALAWLAPFGARLVIYCTVIVGDFKERLQLAEWDVTEVPAANDEMFVFGQTTVSAGSTVELRLKDRMVEVQRDRFTSLATPFSLLSVYDEMVRISGLQLTRTLPDAGITRSVVYQEDKVAALKNLAAIINGVPYMRSDGTLSVRPIAPPANPVASLTVGDEGTITQVGSSLSSEGVYNGVVIRGETDTQGAVLAEKWVETGPLRATPPGGARTPFHRVPRFFSSPFITTVTQAQAALPRLLALYSQTRSSQLQIQCIVDPRLEIGDLVTVNDGVATWTLRLTKISFGDGAYMSVEGDVTNRVLNLN